MAWGVAATISAQVAHDALQGGEAVAFDAARRRVFVASRTSACWVEADVRDAAAPTVVAALCTPRTPLAKVAAWSRSLLFFTALGSRRRRARHDARRQGRRVYARLYGHDLGDFELGRLERSTAHCDDDDDDEEERGRPRSTCGAAER